MKLIQPVIETDKMARQKQIDATVYTVELTGAELRRIGRLSYEHEGGEQYPISGRINELVNELVPDLDLTLPLERGRLR